MQRAFPAIMLPTGPPNDRESVADHEEVRCLRIIPLQSAVTRVHRRIDSMPGGRLFHGIFLLRED
jgi:hypothetical protein